MRHLFYGPTRHLFVYPRTDWTQPGNSVAFPAANYGSNLAPSFPSCFSPPNLPTGHRAHRLKLLYSFLLLQSFAYPSNYERSRKQACDTENYTAPLLHETFLFTTRICSSAPSAQNKYFSQCLIMTGLALANHMTLWNASRAPIYWTERWIAKTCN